MDLQQRRTQLMDAVQAAAIHVERLKGALALCDELLAAAESNGLDPSLDPSLAEQHGS